ncbi:hypothetical protein REPUB_Repub16aG0035400 [Reevesia pubescens]
MKVVPVSADDLAATFESVLNSDCKSKRGVPQLIHHLQHNHNSKHGDEPNKTQILERCEHPVVGNGVCDDCCEKVEDGYGLDFSYIHMGLRLSRSEIHRLSCVESKKLFSQKKLHLVLDIDNTLLHTLKAEDFSKLGVPKDDDDVHEISGYFVKLRPFVSSFLEKASTMFEMYLYTLGSRSYAEKMAKILDPQGKYFGHRIITRDDSPGLVKTLDLVLGKESSVLILDDNERVWPKDQQNLILMKQYMFSGKKKDETEMNSPLNNIINVLYTIHSAFFNDDIRAMLGCSRRDVRQLAAKVRSTVLKRCKLYLSNVKDSELWTMAKDLGATCCNELNFSVTHVVAYKRGSKGFEWAVREKKYLVHPQWIVDAYYLWQRPPEENFPIK